MQLSRLRTDDKFERMDARLENIFRCHSCGFWYIRDEEGPRGECKHCFWNISPKRSAILSVRAVVIMMARELEELLAV